MKALTAIIHLTRSRWAFLLLFVVFSSLLSIVSPPLQVSAALSQTEKQQCYDAFNGKDVTYSRLSIAEQSLYNKCRGEGWCLDAGEGGAVGSRKITCSNPNNNDILQQASSNAASAEVAPLVKLVCGSTPTSDTLIERFMTCASNTRKIYAGCDMTGGPITSSIEDTDQNTAKCVRDGLSNPKPSIQNVLAAVTEGRNAAQKIVDASVAQISLEQRKQECLDSGKEWVNNECKEKTTPAETCRVDGIGWIVCPLVTFMSKVTDDAYNVAEQMLIFTIPNPFETDPKKNPIYALWSSVRNLANIAFVLAFFVVIFSQATSMGISAYGIRKMLPRMVIAAILVNLSYYICVFAIDISNIIGGGLDDLIKALPANSIAPAGRGDATWEVIGSQALTFGAAGAAVALTAVFATGVLFAFLAFSLLAILTALAIFMARHALIIMLIIMAPLAFVAYILPNTENLFDKWRKAFIAMLVMYPLVAVLFAGSQVASSIMLATAGGDSDGGTGGNVAWLYKVAALGVLAIPLFGVPWIVKFSGGFIGRVAGMVNDRSKGLVDRARNKGNESAAIRRGEARGRLAENKVGQKWGLDEKGNPLSGRRNRWKRSIGGGLNQRTQYLGARQEIKKDEKETRKTEYGRKIDHAKTAMYNQTEEQKDGTYAPTAFAGGLATKAAGVGGEAGRERFLQRALQKKIEHGGEERKQAALQQSVSGAHGKGTFFVYDKEGNIVGSHTNTGLALSAIGSGHTIGVIAAGKKAYNDDGTVNMKELRKFTGSDSNGNLNAHGYAALERIAQTADGAAMGYTMHGAEGQEITTIKNGVKDKVADNYSLKALKDKDYDDFMQFVGDNFSAGGTKFSHLYRSDDAINGHNPSTILTVHGTELRAEASRIVQIREEAAALKSKPNATREELELAESREKYANQMETYFISAWNEAQKDPNLAQMRSKKKDKDFQSAIDIIEGKVTRKALREYGDSTDENGNLLGSRSGGFTGKTKVEVVYNKDNKDEASTTTGGGSSSQATDGGLIIPRGASTQSGPSPAATTGATTPPAPDPRESGGNFGGFRYEPPAAPTSPPQPAGGSADATGRYTPNRPDGTPMSQDEADEYHRRNGGA